MRGYRLLMEYLTILVLINLTLLAIATILSYYLVRACI